LSRAAFSIRDGIIEVGALSSRACGASDVLWLYQLVLRHETGAPGTVTFAYGIRRTKINLALGRADDFSFIQKKKKFSGFEPIVTSSEID